MLKILTENELSNVLIVVTRYFGGILLGTGGLVRAYMSAFQEALNKVEIIHKEIGYNVKIEVEYKNLDNLKYILEKNKMKILQINYDKNVELLVEVPESKIGMTENTNFNIIKSQIVTKKYIEI